jgi:predicted choloylglycine hydrolase
MSVKAFIFSGSDYEIGFQQGQSNREAIQKGIAVVFDSKQVKQNKPKLLPKFLFVMLAKRRADKLLRKDLFNLYPKQAERLRGIADGASMDVPSLLFIQMLEMVLCSCTSIGFLPKATSTSETILAKNFDYMNFTEPYSLVCETQPTNGYKTLCCRMVPLSGALDAINEQGLAMTYNLARSVDEPECHVPTSVILQEMLETCKNTQESVDFLAKAKTGGHDGIITLADSTDNIRTVELSCQHVKVREPQGDVVINTNHYQTPEMKSIEIPSIKSQKVQGYRTSPLRFGRVKDLLENRINIDEKLIKTVLRDHGTENIPSANTNCVHGEVGSTTRSMIMYPRKRLMKVLFGHPCENRYQEIKFSEP